MIGIIEFKPTWGKVVFDKEISVKVIVATGPDSSVWHCGSNYGFLHTSVVPMCRRLV
jgi:hypothetical protein